MLIDYYHNKDGLFLLDEGILQRIRSMYTKYENYKDINYFINNFSNLKVSDIIVSVRSDPVLNEKRRIKRDHGKKVFNSKNKSIKESKIDLILDSNNYIDFNINILKNNFNEIKNIRIDNNNSIQNLQEKVNTVITKILI